MSLPKPISVQTINGLNQAGHPPELNYESHKRTIAAVNALITSLGPGVSIKPQNFSLSSGLGTGCVISGTLGTYKRGRFTVTTGSTGFGANPTVTLNFPSGMFDTAPFAQVTRNGGTGTLGYSYVEALNGLTVTLVGTPTAGETYTFQFVVGE